MGTVWEAPVVVDPVVIVEVVGVLIKIVEPTFTTAEAVSCLLLIEVTSIVAWKEKLSKLVVFFRFANCAKSTENATLVPLIAGIALNTIELHEPVIY